jgi:uncharacterized protein YcbX
MVTVEELHVYPLKSGRGIAKSTVRLAATGFEWDRHWMITDPAGTFLTQRTHPKLACIQTELSEVALTLRAPGLRPLELPLVPQGEATAVTVWRDHCEGLDQGPEASQWASTALGVSVRLMRAPPTPRRVANREFAGPRPVALAFPDGYPILVCNRASLEDLNTRMPVPIPMERFRPNIVLKGLPPFAEDRISSISIGEVRLNLVKPCTRCIITSTDQRTGELSTNPLPVLRLFRFDRALKGVKFGENAVPVEGVGGHIALGAECLARYEG